MPVGVSVEGFDGSTHVLEPVPQIGNAHTADSNAFASTVHDDSVNRCGHEAAGAQFPRVFSVPATVSQTRGLAFRIGNSTAFAPDCYAAVGGYGNSFSSTIAQGYGQRC